jgi:ankyrin repeat protein
MPPAHFPLRWESTGDQWWFASPIDWAAANGHYDLVHELLRLDSNHLINLASLRRIRRLEVVWDDEEQFDDVAKNRSIVARKLLSECESRRGKTSLVRGGYGGWLLYTAASAGDLSFVKELLERDPLLVFGEGEYGVTDILYAAARSKNCEVFRVLYDSAISPRFLAGNGTRFEESNGEIPFAYKREMMNRALHAAARGGNLEILKEILGDSSDVLSYRDIKGSTILHAAAGRGQVQVVKDLIASYEIINSIDNHGNTALHIAAYRGQLAVVETLILASSSCIHTTNNNGETFLHLAVTGFRIRSFRRLDRQVELMNQLLFGNVFDAAEIINAKNNEGRTALHLAIIGNMHSDLLKLLMSVNSIEVNICDNNGMTPLDLLKQRPRSASSEILTRQLLSAGGIFGSERFSRSAASHLKRLSIGDSPGTSFKVSDTEIFFHTGVSDYGKRDVLDICQTDSCESITETRTPRKNKHISPVNHLKRLLHLPKMKERKKPEEPISLRERYMNNKSSLANNKRTLAVRSNLSSPNAKKKHRVPHRSRSSSFSKSSGSYSSEKHTGLFFEDEDLYDADQVKDDELTGSVVHKHGFINKRLMNQCFCFGASGVPVKAPAGRQHSEEPDRSAVSAC